METNYDKQDVGRKELGQDVWYSPDTGFVMRDVTAHIPEQHSMTVGGEVLLPKDEYHVTLLNLGKYTDEPQAQAAIVEQIQQSLGEIDLGQIDFEGMRRYLCQVGDEVTVVGLIDDTEGVQELKQQIRGLLPEYKQLSHVTLLKNEASTHGIAVSSEEFLEENGIATDDIEGSISSEKKENGWENMMRYGSERFETTVANNHNVILFDNVKVPTKLVLGKDVALVLPKNADRLDIWEGYPTHQESWLPMWFVLLRHSQAQSPDEAEYLDEVAKRVTGEDYDLVQKALIYKAQEFINKFDKKDNQSEHKKYKNLTRVLQDTLLYVDASEGVIYDQQVYIESHELYPLVQRANELRNGIGLDSADEFVETVRAVVDSYVEQFGNSELAIAHQELLQKIADHSNGEVVLLPDASIEDAEKYRQLVSYDLLMSDDEHDKDVVSIVDGLERPEFHQVVVKKGEGLKEERRVDVIAIPESLEIWDVAEGGKESYQPISMIVATHTVPETVRGQEMLERISEKLSANDIAHHYLGAAEEFLHQKAWGKSYKERIERTDIPQIKKVIPLYRVACDLLPRAIYMLKTNELPAGVANEALWEVGEVTEATDMIEDMFARQDATDEELRQLYEVIETKFKQYFTDTDYMFFLSNMETMRQGKISGFAGARL